MLSFEHKAKTVSGRHHFNNWNFLNLNIARYLLGKNGIRNATEVYSSSKV